MENDLTYVTQKLQEGEESAYVFLFYRYYIPLCSYSYRYVGRKDIAEEIVSDTFFNIWCNRATLEIRSSVKGYLFQAVCNNSLNYLRKFKKEIRWDDDCNGVSLNDIDFAVNTEEAPPDYLILKELTETIDNAVNSLPRQQQTVFRLKRYEGKKMKEIADIMGLSVKTVEMHISKAMISLRKDLKEYLPG